MGRESGRGTYSFFAQAPPNDRSVLMLLGQSLTEWRPGRETVPLRPDLFARYIARHWEGSTGLGMLVEQTKEVDDGRGVRLATDQAAFAISARSVTTPHTEQALHFQLSSLGGASGEQGRGGPLVLPVIPNTPLSIRFEAESFMPDVDYVSDVGVLAAYTTQDSRGTVQVRPFVREKKGVGMQLSQELLMLRRRMHDEEFVLPVPHLPEPTLFDTEKPPFDPLFFLLLVPQRRLRPDEIKPSYPSRENSALLSIGPSLRVQPGRDGSPAFPLVQNSADDRSVWSAAVPVVIQLVRDL